MSFWISFWVVIFFTNITVCWGLCNLCRRVNVSTDQSSIYRYSDQDINLTADRAVDGEFEDHKNGDCAGTGIGTHTQAWWNISLPDLADIYKINLMFRKNCTRHSGYYVFINKVVADVDELTNLSPVYYESDSRPSAQNIIMFPGGISGKQLYIYKNTSDLSQTQNVTNILDICEIEIWGCLNHTEENNCKCSLGKHYTALQSACVEATYNAKTTYLENIRPIILSVGDNVTLVCKNGHRLEAGNLTRVCQKNGSWSGEEPICKPCTVAFNASTTEAQYFQPNDTLNVGDNVTYTCKKTHRLVAGNLTRICQVNGLWSGEKPICKRCKCPCKRLASQSFIKDPIVLQERMEETKKILKVNRSELSAFKRKKISSHDGRASAKGLGMFLGVGVITFVIGVIVCSDVFTCRARKQRKVFRNTF